MIPIPQAAVIRKPLPHPSHAFNITASGSGSASR